MLRERRPAVPEAHVVRMWLAAAVPDSTFVTTDGEKVRVLDPGRQNRHDGPDFLGATIVLDGVLRRGDIEIHVRTRDWERHGHHEDERYRNVVLHVCLYAERAGGTQPPTVILAMQLGQSLRKAWSTARRAPPELRCALRLPGPVHCTAEAALELAAAERFSRKCARIRTRLSELAAVLDRGPAFRQVVYEAVARGMGFGGNEEQFALLARALPLAELSQRPAAERRQRLLQTAERILAGGDEKMVPHRREEARDGVVVQSSEIMCATGGPAWWNRSGIMPHNRHERRLQWFADWCCQLDDRRWWRNCFRLMQARMPQSRDFQPQFSVGHPARHPGRERVHELVVNVLAPAVAVHAAERKRPELGAAAAALYFRLPSPPQNRRTRIVASALHVACDVTARQQGMVELHAEYCSRHRCRECLLSIRQG